MFKKKIIAASAVAMLGMSGLAVPSAAAQTATSVTSGSVIDGYTKAYDMNELIPAGTPGVLRDGTNETVPTLENETPVAGMPRYKGYEYEGESFVMELRRRNDSPKTAAGEPIWGYYIAAKNGDRSDQCHIDLKTKSVNDPKLIDYSRNGFLYTLSGASGNGKDSVNLHTDVQHWGGNWRFPYLFGEALHNAKFDVQFPTNWAQPKLSESTLFTLRGNGESSITTASGAAADSSEFLTVQPFDAAANAAREKAGLYPNQRTFHNPDNWVTPHVIETGNPYFKQLSIPYAPEGSRFVVEWKQQKPQSEADKVPNSTVTFVADKFCYAEDTVQQGTEKTVPAPSGTAGVTGMEFKPVPDAPETPGTPKWVTVGSDGRLTLKPGFDVEVGTYKFPVLVGTPKTEYKPVQVTIKVTPAYFVDGYDDSYTGPCIATVSYPQTLRSIPDDAKFELVEDSVPENWEAKVDSETGKLTVTPDKDAVPGRQTITVNVTYTAADGSTKSAPLEAGIQVDRRVTKFEVPESGEKAGHLVVTYNDKTTNDLGKVVGPAGAKGDSVRIKESTTDANGNTVITFETIGSDGQSSGNTTSVTVSKGPQGEPGKDGQSPTILEQHTNNDGSVKIIFTDGTSVTVPAPKDPTIVSQEKDANGDLVITWSNGQTTTIPQGPAGKDGEDGKNGLDGRDAASSSDSLPATCIPAGLRVGLPLLALIPVGLAAKLHFPGIAPLLDQMNGEIERVNLQFQQQAGVLNPQAAALASNVSTLSKQLGEVGTVALGGAAAIGLGVLVANYLAQNCSPAEDTNASTSSVGTSSFELG